MPLINIQPYNTGSGLALSKGLALREDLANARLNRRIREEQLAQAEQQNAAQAQQQELARAILNASRGGGLSLPTGIVPNQPTGLEGLERQAPAAIPGISEAGATGGGGLQGLAAGALGAIDQAGQAQAQPQPQAQPQRTPEQNQFIAEQMENLIISNPELAKKVQTAMGYNTAEKQREGRNFASELRNTPFSLREKKIISRADKLRSEGRDPSQTLDLLGKDEQTQNSLIDLLETINVPADQRMAFRKERAAVKKADLENLLTEEEYKNIKNKMPADIQSSTIVEGTGVQWIDKRGRVGFTFLNEEDKKRFDERTEDLNIKEAQAEGRKQGRIEAAKNDAKLNADIKNQGLLASQTLPTITRLRFLNKNIRVGGYAGYLRQVTDFLGTTPADEGVFRSEVNKLVLSEIKKLGQNPTEGERKFLNEAQAQINSGSREVNDALLKRLQEISIAQIERARQVQQTGRVEVPSVEEIFSGKYSSTTSINKVPKIDTSRRDPDLDALLVK